MTNRQTAGAVVVAAAALLAVACGDANGVSGPTGVPATRQLSVADLPPSNVKEMSCPHDAPTQLTVHVDEWVEGRGWKVTIELRPTSASIATYIVRYQLAGAPVRSLTLGARPVTTEYFVNPGIYSFQAQASCGDGLGVLSAAVVKNVGEGSFNFDHTPPPPPLPADWCEDKA